jgi:DNA-directed RNA polymerase specialized sigma24 family protein
MGRGNCTKTEGMGPAFPTTHWSLVEAARSGDGDRVAIGILLNRYWKPVYCYLLRRGYDSEQAKDLTQGFFHEIVLERRLVEKADPSKGRFRTFLLLALDRYVANVRKQEHSQKRAPAGHLVPLDIIRPPVLPRSVAASTPEDTFHYAWVSELLERVLEHVEAKCHEDGKTVHWYAFRDRVLRPIVDQTPPPSLQEICSRYGIQSETKASNMMITVKRRLQSTLRQHVRNSVASDELVESELGEICKFFPVLAQESK